MQAIATRELRSRMRGARAFTVLTVYLLILTCFVTAVYAFVVNVTEQTGGPPPPLGRIVFYVVTVVELLLIAPLTAAFGAGAVAGERERQTLDLVLTTPIRARDFVLGKLGANLSYVLLLVFAALPVQVLSLLLGGLTLTEVVLAVWILAVTAASYAASSLFFSSIMRTTTLASVFSYLVVAASLASALFVMLLTSVIGRATFLDLLGGSSGAPTDAAVYGSLVILSLSPLTAGGLTAAGLIAGFDPFVFHLGAGSVPSRPEGFLIISPWIIYSAVYITVSALLVWLAIRRLRPRSAGRRAGVAQAGG